MTAHVRLCMIVRNEAETLPALAESVAGIIDSWCIVDNGSTDDTERVAKECFGHLPGQFLTSQLPEFDFGSARNEMLDLAREPGVYLLLMDADTPLVGTIDKDALTEPMYFAPVVCAGREWQMPLLVRSDVECLYVGRAHEYLEFGDTTFGTLTTCAANRVSVGANEDRLRWYIEVLTEDFEERNDARAAFYLGNTYADLHEDDKAIEWYAKRAAMGGSAEEVFLAIYRCAELDERRGDLRKAMRVFFEAAAYRPDRPEPWFRLAKLANYFGEHQCALGFAERGLCLPKSTDILVVERWVENWGLYLEAAVASWHLGNKADASEAFEKILARPDVPEDMKDVCREALSVSKKNTPSKNKAKKRRR